MKSRAALIPAFLLTTAVSACREPASQDSSSGPTNQDYNRAFIACVERDLGGTGVKRTFLDTESPHGANGDTLLVRFGTVQNPNLVTVSYDATRGIFSGGQIKRADSSLEARAAEASAMKCAAYNAGLSNMRLIPPTGIK
jgi:hypothetical protein